ncbi:MAG: carboxypeptidase-like regulatory domain-containing protein [Planctomycetaceae bacterium]|nr:carboxypeptidase-like regulatory domain-containing protein [Planctomycetaceae bacterium]
MPVFGTAIGKPVIFGGAMRSILRAFILMLVIAGGFIPNGGCRNDRLEGLAPVEGTVRYQGTALEGAIVSFEPASGTGMAASCYTDAQGRFRLTTRHPGDGIFPGDYCISIDKVTVLFMPTEEEAEKYLQETGKELLPKTRIDVPEKYRTAETSGLKLTVPQSGIQNLSIDLVD